MVCHCNPPQEGKLGCGDECLNRILNIECVQGTCPCGDHCSNQQVYKLLIFLIKNILLFGLFVKWHDCWPNVWFQFQKRKYASLRWFKCGKKGYGLKALEDVAQGQFLIEYVGEVTCTILLFLFIIPMLILKLLLIILLYYMKYWLLRPNIDIFYHICALVHTSVEILGKRKEEI